MTHSEAAAAVGRRVRIISGHYSNRTGSPWTASIRGVTRKLVEVKIDGYWRLVRLAPCRLELIEKEETP